MWFQFGPPGTEPGQKKAHIFQVGSWRKDEWKPHGEPRKKLTHQFGGGGEGGRRVGYLFKSLCDFCPSKLNCFHTLW